MERVDCEVGDLVLMDWSMFGVYRQSFGHVKAVDNRAITVEAATNCGGGKIERLPCTIPWRRVTNFEIKDRKGG